MPSVADRGQRDRRFDHLFFSGMAVLILASVLSDLRTAAISQRFRSSVAQPAGSYPWRSVFLLDRIADRANLSGGRRRHGCASPPGTGGLWLGMFGGRPGRAGGD